MLVTVVGGGHTIPHPRNRMPRLLGPTSHDADAVAAIWEFFESARKRVTPWTGSSEGGP